MNSTLEEFIERKFKQTLNVIHKKEMYQFASIDDEYCENENKDVSLTGDLVYFKSPHFYQFNLTELVKSEIKIEKFIDELQFLLLKLKINIIEETDEISEKIMKLTISSPSDELEELIRTLFDVYMDTKIVKIIEKTIAQTQ